MALRFSVVLAAVASVACAPSPAAAPTATTAPKPAAPTVAAVPSPSPARPASPSPSLSPSPSPLAGPLQLGSFAYNDRGTESVVGKAELDLEADDFYFSPTFLLGSPGQKLKLEIENEGKEKHNLSISAQQLDKDVDPDGKIDVEVAFPPSGALRFFCKYHASLGMNGQLLAGDATPQPVSERGGY